MKQMRLIFENDEGKKLENIREELKIYGKWKSWEDYFLKLAKVRK